MRQESNSSPEEAVVRRRKREARKTTFTGASFCHPVDRHVGQRIRFRRVQVKMSQSALGEAIGVSFQQIQKYELGRNRVSMSVLFDIAQTLGTPVGFFVDGLNPIIGDPKPLDQTAQLQLDYAASAEGMRLLDLMMKLPARVRSDVLRLLNAVVDETQQARRQDLNAG